jgi:restriction endonuclease
MSRYGCRSGNLYDPTTPLSLKNDSIVRSLGVIFIPKIADYINQDNNKKSSIKGDYEPRDN